MKRVFCRHSSFLQAKMNRFKLLLALAAISIPSVFNIPANGDEIRSFLENASETSYLQSNGNDLELVETGNRRHQGDTVYQKLHDGIPVHGDFVRVLRDSTGNILSVKDDSSQNVEYQFVRPKFTKQQAVATINSQITNSRAFGSDAELVWFRSGQKAHLAWEITTQLAKIDEDVSPTGLVTVVDASNSEIVSQTQTDDTDYLPEANGTVTGVFPRIVINNSIGSAGSRGYASSFDAVVALDFGCTGVLIAPNVVLSARHCGAFAGDQVIFGANSNNGTFTATIQSSMLPDGNGSLLDGGDVAILRLSTNVPANIATPMRLLDATTELEGMVAATVGYGYNGVGSQGHQFTADGRRWGGENIIDRYGSPADASGSNIISTDFDNGSSNANTISGSSSTPLQFEATTAPGDSGGPIMVQVNGEWVIAGVLSGGTTNTSVYGDISWWTGTAPYRSQIEAQGGEFLDETNNKTLLGDINQDGVINLLDVGPFVEILSNAGFQAEADMNQDGTVNLLDVDGFINVLSN